MYPAHARTPLTSAISLAHAGFGELFARNVLGVRLGWPLASSSSSTASSTRANTSSVGLRAAGRTNPNIGHEVPGHAGAKTVAEAAGEAVREAAE